MADKRQNERSLAGAARSARDARIATVKYQRNAPIARLWQSAKLQRAFQLQLAHVGDPDVAGALLFGGLGYKPPFPSNWEAAAELVLADEAQYLAAADLYILTPQMCDVVIAAAQTLTRQDLEMVGEDDLPGRTGLVVLPHPIIVQAVTGDLGDDRAFTWRFPSQIRGPDGRRRFKDYPAVRMSAYHDSYGPVRPDSFLDFAAQARALGTPLPPLLLDAIRCVPLRYAARPDRCWRARSTSRQSGRPVMRLASRRPLSVRTRTGWWASTRRVSRSRTGMTRSCRGSCMPSGGCASSKSPVSAQPRSTTARR
jgi:hypothetical protein